MNKRKLGKQIANHIAKILIDVQPMTGPVGQIFTLKVKYGPGFCSGKWGIDDENEEETRTDFGSEFGNE